MLIGLGGGPVGPINEDCPALKIWTKPQVGHGPKAVFFWIYGRCKSWLLTYPNFNYIDGEGLTKQLRIYYWSDK